MSKKNYVDSIWNITNYIRKWIEKNTFQEGFIYVLVLLALCQWAISELALHIMAEVGVGLSGNEEREVRAAMNSPLLLFILGGGQIIRMYVVFLLTVFYYQYKKGLINIKRKWFFFSIIGFEFFLFIQGSRIDLLETVVFILLIIYSIRKNTIKTKALLKTLIVISFVAIIVFPLITGIRFARKIVITSNSDITIVDVIKMGTDMIFSGDIDLESVDNKGSRMWDFYQSLALGAATNFEGFGSLTTNAVLHSVPSAIFPDKPEGSETMIERLTGTDTDMTDSFLLLGMMESKLMGPLWGILLYVIVFSSISVCNKLLYGFLPQKLCIPFVIGQFFSWCNHVEVTFDTWLSAIIALIIWYMIFWMFFIIIPNKYKLKKTKVYDNN